MADARTGLAEPADHQVLGGQVLGAADRGRPGRTHTGGRVDHGVLPSKTSDEGKPSSWEDIGMVGC